MRFLGNRSSGRQGYALALVAAARGAEVTVVAAQRRAARPDRREVLPVRSAAELRDVTLVAAADADVVVMAAAVADFRPARPSRPRSRRRPARRRRSRWSAPRTCCRAGGRAPARPAGRRLRRRDRRRRGRLARPRPAQAGPQGLRPAGGQPGRRRAGLRHPNRQPRGGADRGRRRGRGAARPQGGPGRAPSGTLVDSPAWPDYQLDGLCRGRTARPGRAVQVRPGDPLGQRDELGRARVAVPVVCAQPCAAGRTPGRRSGRAARAGSSRRGRRRGSRRCSPAARVPGRQLHSAGWPAGVRLVEGCCGSPAVCSAHSHSA